MIATHDEASRVVRIVRFVLILDTMPLLRFVFRHCTIVVQLFGHKASSGTETRAFRSGTAPAICYTFYPVIRRPAHPNYCLGQPYSLNRVPR